MVNMEPLSLVTRTIYSYIYVCTIYSDSLDHKTSNDVINRSIAYYVFLILKRNFSNCVTALLRSNKSAQYYLAKSLKRINKNRPHKRVWSLFLRTAKYTKVVLHPTLNWWCCLTRTLACLCYCCCYYCCFQLFAMNTTHNSLINFKSTIA